jgi:Raf kinase inhibitor-like YbhB/YbcL family protein
MKLISDAFQEGAEIPSRYTSQGGNISPNVSWKEAPSSTKSFVLIVHDPDAPRSGGFTHWVVYNIGPSTGKIAENAPTEPQLPGVGIQGRNDAGKVGYLGPAPPSGVHRYFFRLYALDSTLDLPPAASAAEVSNSVKGHVLAQAELMGTYEKKTQRVA